ncbi:terminase small subunit [Bacillus phage vB_Bacillus_1020A]|uniref:terminase large subunit n=1 Tax=Robertmurraya sp. DFI.2.37 TaxID=3031819 RepID=UPI001246359B|nr:terminase TerL endonuclease subunit [Robertmurraya sp. DFI.2.37]MDF1510816.1 terminase large subunit [Robertmurraya sp. DFI.2.37]QIW89296.1 terminase small subunit [Bacillus phage vB_Bacillus_1020A]
MNVLERVFAYCDDILEGRIKACKKHKWAVKRFLRDYNDCLNNPDSPFYFDEEVGEDFYWFSREFKHVEGVLAGEPVELTDFQLFISTNIFCFKKKRNGARRFRKVYIQLARKNAKSQFLAIVGAYVAFLGVEKQRIYIAGWQKDQSDEVYVAVREGIGSSSLLDGKWKEAYGKIEILRNGSVIVPLSRETRKTGDGKNPSVGIVDEYHNHLTSEIYDVLQSGMVARKEPLMFVITTAGFDLSRPCFIEYEYISRILDPDDDIENDDYFAIVCELDAGDDIKDESNWIKANPIVATYEEGIESIRSDLKTALDVPEKMRSFMTKTMNIWVDVKVGGYIPSSKWKACRFDLVFGENEVLDITGRDVYIGVDLSKRIDLTSGGFVFPTEYGHHVKQHSFMPEEALTERRVKDKVPYDLWIEKGWLDVTPGAVVDYGYVEDWILNFINDYELNPILFCYDPYGATQFAQNMAAQGLTTVEIRQGFQTLSEPTKEFRDYVYQKKITHDGDKLLSWAVGNAITDMAGNESIKLSKAKSRERIDPIAAIITAFVQARFAQVNSGSGNISFISVNDL